MLVIVLAFLVFSSGLSGQIAPRTDPPVTVGAFGSAGEVILENPIGGVLLGGGSFVVADFRQGLYQLLFFDSAGGLTKTAGGWGDGPFERTSAPHMIDLTQEGHLMIAGQDGKWTTLDTNGKGLDSGRWPAAPFGFFPVGLVGSRIAGFTRVRGAISGELVDYEWRLQEFDPGSESVSDLASYRVPERLGRIGPLLELPFPVQILFDARGGAAAFGSTAERAVTATAISGRVSMPWEPERVTESDRDTWMESNVRRFPRHGAEVRRWNRTVDFPDHLPSVAAIYVDRKDRLWMQKYESAESDAPFTFAVFDQSGTVVEEFSLPFETLGRAGRRAMPGVSPVLDIDGSRMLIRSTGEYGEMIVSVIDLGVD